MDIDFDAIESVGIDLFGTLFEERSAYERLEARGYEVSLLEDYGYQVDSDSYYEAQKTVLQRFSRNAKNVHQRELGVIVSQVLSYLDFNPSATVCEAIHKEFITELISTGRVREGFETFAGHCNSQNIELYLLTNSTPFEVEAFFDKYTDFRQYFEEVFSAHEVGIGKSSEQYFMTILEKISVQPEEFLMLGDKEAYDGNIQRIGGYYVKIASSQQESCHTFLELLERLKNG